MSATLVIKLWRYEKRNAIISDDLRRELFLSCVLARRRKADAWRPHSGRTRKRPQTHSGRTAPAGRTHPRAPVNAQWTQDTHVLDAVFDKLFLGSTVVLRKLILK